MKTYHQKNKIIFFENSKEIMKFSLHEGLKNTLFLNFKHYNLIIDIVYMVLFLKIAIFSHEKQF